MECSHGDKRMNVEDDRLSTLPDELIHKILSFIGIKHAIQTSALSSRWRFIWTSMPYLNFSRDDLYRSPKFSEFVTHVLSGRNNQAEVSSVELSFHGEDGYVIGEQIMKYAFSHNIQQLIVACSFNKYNVEFPSFLSSSRSLKHLSVTNAYFKAADFKATPYYWMRRSFSYVFKATSIWELPALTTLYLHDVTLRCDENTDECNDPFSKCANLKSLTLKGCYINGLTDLSICLPLLSNLTLESVRGNVEFFDIVAPQLKNLTIIDSLADHQYLISAPDLVFLLYKGCSGVPLSTGGFLSLEKADICVFSPRDTNRVLCLLQQLHNVKFLTLNLEIVELLSSSVEIMSLQPSPFANLKSLKIHPAKIWGVREHYGVKMSAELKSYLLGSSPGAIFTMVSREDIRAMQNTKLAQNRITALRALLEQEKARTDTKMTKMHEQETPQSSEHIDTYIDMCWKYLSVQIEKGKEKASQIISELKEIKDLLTELPASNRATIQPSFSTLCAEVDIVINKITDCTKLLCDENQRRLSVRVHELATTLQPSS